MIRKLYVVRVLTGPAHNLIRQYARNEWIWGPFRIEFSPNFDERSVLSEERAVQALKEAKKSPALFRSPELVDVLLGEALSPRKVRHFLYNARIADSQLTSIEQKLLGRG